MEIGQKQRTRTRNKERTSLVQCLLSNAFQKPKRTKESLCSFTHKWVQRTKPLLYKKGQQIIYNYSQSETHTKQFSVSAHQQNNKVNKTNYDNPTPPTSALAHNSQHTIKKQNKTKRTKQPTQQASQQK